MQSVVAHKDTLKNTQKKGNKALVEKAQPFGISLNRISQRKINFFCRHIIAASATSWRFDCDNSNIVWDDDATS